MNDFSCHSTMLQLAIALFTNHEPLPLLIIFRYPECNIHNIVSNPRQDKWLL